MAMRRASGLGCGHSGRTPLGVGIAALLAVLALVAVGTAQAIVGGTRDCSHNALGEPGSGCSYPTVGAMVASFEPTGWVSGCTSRLIYNGSTEAVVLTAAHCMLE